jgi:hypothetical protein
MHAVLTEEPDDTFIDGQLLEPDGPNGDVKLSGQHQSEQPESEPRTVDTSSSTERKFLDRVSLNLPSLSESDMTQTDAHPGEDGRETGEGQQPVEHLSTDRGDVDIGDRAERQDGNDGPKRSSRLVDVGEEPGSVPGLRQGGEGTGTGVDTRETDGEDGNTDGSVDEMIQTLDVGIVESQDEGGSGSVVRRSTTQQPLIVVRNQQPDQSQGSDVDQSDTPESILDCTGHGLPWVRSLGSGQSDQLGSGERESGGDEYRTDSLESVTESARIAVVSSSDVRVVPTSGGSSSTYEDDTGDDEDDGDQEFQA